MNVYRTVEHTCGGVDHTAPIYVTEITRCVAGVRYRGVRCDGTRIEWVEPYEEKP